jgi:hypothetical protein
MNSGKYTNLRRMSVNDTETPTYTSTYHTSTVLSTPPTNRHTHARARASAYDTGYTRPTYLFDSHMLSHQLPLAGFIFLCLNRRYDMPSPHRFPRLRKRGFQLQLCYIRPAGIAIPCMHHTETESEKREREPLSSNECVANLLGLRHIPRRKVLDYELAHVFVGCCAKIGLVRANK